MAQDLTREAKIQSIVDAQLGDHLHEVSIKSVVDPDGTPIDLVSITLDATETADFDQLTAIRVKVERLYSAENPPKSFELRFLVNVSATISGVGSASAYADRTIRKIEEIIENLR
jgi:hypothetical protein